MTRYIVTHEWTMQPPRLPQIRLNCPDQAYLIRITERSASRRSGIWGGKSGLQRAECLLTGGRSNPMESATENTPPCLFRQGKVEKAR
ncbi:hypothetical protein ACFL96_16305 [Thermoproteota archaeon]